MNIHPIIDKPPSFPQTVLRLLTGSTHCCDWCEKRWIKVHRTGQLECRNRRCPYCGQYGCPRAEKHWKKCPVWNHMTTPAWLYPVAKRLCWNSCKWDGVDSYAAKDEDDAWNYAGEIPGFHEEYIRQAKELLALARKAVNE